MTTLPDHPDVWIILCQCRSSNGFSVVDNGLNVEPLKQGPRSEIRPRQAIGDVIIGLVGSVWTKMFGYAKNRFKGMVDPHPAGGSTQQMKIFGKHSPDFSTIGFCRATIATWHAQIGQVDTLRKQHSKNVVVRCNEQLCRVWKCLVFSKPARVSVTMWANQRQVFYSVRIIPARSSGLQVRLGKGGLRQADSYHCIPIFAADAQFVSVASDRPGTDRCFANP